MPNSIFGNAGRFGASFRTMVKAPAAGKSVSARDFFPDTHWWLFCLLIFALNFLLLSLDPLPKLFMGDSASYLHTALSGGVPRDRSFLYGYIIRWSSLWAGLLASVLILQAFLRVSDRHFSRGYLPGDFRACFWTVLSFRPYIVRWIRCNWCGSAT